MREGGKRLKETLREDGRDNKLPAYYTKQAYCTKRKDERGRSR